MRKNDVIELNITGMTSEGNGVGRYNDFAVFVPLTDIGDKAEVKIIKVLKSYAVGKLISLIEPSENRIDNNCGAFKSCGGCSYRHIDYGHELMIKKNMVKESFKRIAKIETDEFDIIGADEISGYRNKAMYPIRKDNNGVIVSGFFGKNSHRIVECDDCRLQPPLFNEILAEILEFIKENNISVYDEESNTGLIRHVYIRYAQITGEIMVCIVINGRRIPFSDKLIDRLTKGFEGIKSIFININTEKTNVILGNKCVLLWGKNSITDRICSIDIKISPLSFYQVNRSMAEKLYEIAGNWAGLCGRETVVDLYCGTGTIGLTMADKAKAVIGVEVVPQAVEDASENAKRNGIENAKFICGDAYEAAVQLEKEGIKADVVIVDPPRKGLEKGLAEFISTKLSPERIVYISCDPATLARDCAVFKDFGYEIKKIKAVDLFARTSHVECVVMMSRTQI